MPIVGLMLSIAALGNLIQSYGNGYKSIAGALATIIFIVVTIKFLCDFKTLKKELETPIGASVFPTYTMGMMLLATYLKPYQSQIAFGVWIVAILLHLVLMVYFTAKFVKNFNIMQVFPSWFIVYVGIAVASVTGKAFQQNIGQFAFYFALLSYLILLPIVTKRVLFIKKFPEPALPTLIIFSAPGSLCLAGYINSFDTKNLLLFWILLVLSQAIYILALVKLVQLLRLPFYPSYSGFTFPLVISAIALKTSTAFLIGQNYSVACLPLLVKAEELVAVLIVLYVFIRYVCHIVKLTCNKGVSNT